MQVPSIRDAAQVMLVLTASLLIWQPETRGDQPLTWKFQDGQKVNYDIAQKMNMAMEVAGQQLQMTIDQDMSMTTEVKQVQPDGTAKLQQRITRVKVTANGGPLGENVYDSEDKTANKGQLAGSFEQSWGKLINKDITMSVTTTGTVKDLELPEGADALANAGNPVGGGGQVGSLKELVSKSMLAFPEGDVEVGQKWDNQASVQLPFGKMTTKTQYEYLGRKGDIAEIKVMPTSSIEAKANSPFQVKISEQKAEGTIQFDTVKGQILSSSMSMDMVMSISVQGNNIKQNIKQTVEMKKKD